MTTLRNCDYERLVRRHLLEGAALLRLPWDRLWTDYLADFQSAVLGHLTGGRPVSDPTRVLEQAGLTSDLLALSPRFEGYEPGVPRLTWTRAGLLQLADACDDFARDDGSWSGRHRQELEVPKADVLAAINEGAAKVKDQVAREHGIDQAAQMVRYLSDQIKAATGRDNARAWTSSDAQELREHARTLRTLANPRGFWGVVCKFRPHTNAKWLLSGAQRNTIARRLYPALQRAASKRHQDQVRRVVDDICRQVVGEPPAAQGTLGELLHDLEAQQAFFDKLRPDSSPPLPRNAAPHEVVLVQSLDAVIDTSTQRRFITLFEEAVAQAGRSPRALANQLLARGIERNGQAFRPSDWHTLDPVDVRRALAHIVKRYLGADKPDERINLDSPRSAFEYAAQVTLLHPALEKLLKGVLGPWVQKSVPYGEMNGLPNAQQQAHVLLYCYFPHRSAFVELLDTQVTINNAKDEADAYAMQTPYVAMLCQYRIGAALSCLKDLPRWYRHSSGAPTHLDRNRFPEFRRLCQRPQDWDDAQALFTAAQNLGFIKALPAPRSGLVLALPHPELDALFAPRTATPALKTAKEFHQLLQSADFQRLLEATYFQASQESAADLARGEPEAAAEKLVSLGIIERGPGGHYRYLGTSGDEITKDLFVWKAGPLVGLSEDEFVGHMLRNDLLYAVLFFKVSDALVAGQIGAADVPPFLASFTAALG